MNRLYFKLVLICVRRERKRQRVRLSREGEIRGTHTHKHTHKCTCLLIWCCFLMNEETICLQIRLIFLSWPFIVVVMLMLLDSVGSVNINHFPWRVFKFIFLNPKYMEQFVKILTSILCQVIGFSRIRGLLIWEAISPQDCNNKDSVVVADSFIYPAHIYCILLCARYQRYKDD